MPDDTPAPAPPALKRRRRRRRIVRGCALALLLAGTVAFITARTPPKAWRAHQDYLAQTTPEERAAVARGVLDKLEQLADDAAADPPQTDHHPSDASAALLSPNGATRSGARGDIAFDRLDAIAPDDATIDRLVHVELTNAEMSSLVATWFDTWAEQRGFIVPDWLDRPVVGAFDGDLSVAFAASHGGWSQVFGGPLNLTFHDTGMAEGSVARLTVGSLPVPVHEVGEALSRPGAAAPDDAADDIGGWVARLESFEFRPVLELAHRRRARVIAMAVGDGSVSLTIRLQDHRTYKRLNTALAAGEADVFGGLPAIADVPATSD